jgi:hypothetical protein
MLEFGAACQLWQRCSHLGFGNADVGVTENPVRVHIITEIGRGNRGRYLSFYRRHVCVGHYPAAVNIAG